MTVCSFALHKFIFLGKMAITLTLTNCPIAFVLFMEGMYVRNNKELAALTNFIIEHFHHEGSYVVWSYGRKSVKATVFDNDFDYNLGPKPHEYNLNIHTQKVTEKNSDGGIEIGQTEIVAEGFEDYELRFNFRELSPVMRRLKKIDFRAFAELLSKLA